MLVEQNTSGSGARVATFSWLFALGCALILVSGFELAVGKEPMNNSRRKRNRSYALQYTSPAFDWPIRLAQNSLIVGHRVIPSTPRGPYWPLHQLQRFQSGTRRNPLPRRLHELRLPNALPPYGISQATSRRSVRTSQQIINMGRFISTSPPRPQTRATGFNPQRHRTSGGVPITGTGQPATFVTY